MSTQDKEKDKDSKIIKSFVVHDGWLKVLVTHTSTIKKLFGKKHQKRFYVIHFQYPDKFQLHVSTNYKMWQ